MISNLPDADLLEAAEFCILKDYYLVAVGFTVN